MRIVFHGANAASFSSGFAALLDAKAELAVLPDALTSAAGRATYAAAEVIVGVAFDSDLPRPKALRLFQVPGAGYDQVDLAALPAAAVVCNCFGHETAIAEYVMAVLLMRAVPLLDADRRLRQGEWAYWAGAPERVHGELAGRRLGLLGFGHIGQAIARRAKAFELDVLVGNRSPVDSPLVERWYPLDRLHEFWPAIDALVVALPLTAATRGLVGAAALAALPRHAVVINVGRGPLIDEQALYDALRERRIAGAAIDTWYRYPASAEERVLPSALPFHELDNVVMTPHMSGWTEGTIRRRQQTIADNVARLAAGRPCINVIRPAG